MKQFVEGEDRSFREGRSPERRPVLSARGFPVPHGDLSRGGVAVVQQRTTPFLAIRQVSFAIAEPASPRGSSLLPDAVSDWLILAAWPIWNSVPSAIMARMMVLSLQGEAAGIRFCD